MAFFFISRRHPLRLLSTADLVAEYERLVLENEQLRQAVTSHAVIDQAMGAVVVLGRVAPEEAWRVLRDVSQHTNTKLRTVAEHVLVFARGGTMPEPLRAELGRAMERYRMCSSAPTEPVGEPVGEPTTEERVSGRSATEPPGC
jgi:hypothetical protein